MATVDLTPLAPNFNIPPPAKAPAPTPAPIAPAEPITPVTPAPSHVLSPADTTPAPSAETPEPVKGYYPLKSLDIPAKGRALLGTIGGPGFESNGTYTQRFGQPDFSDFSQHPNTYAPIKAGPYRGLKSNAAGRFQLISTTYGEQAKKQNLNDFYPESQEKAAWGVAKDAYAQKYKGGDLEKDLEDPKKFPRVVKALKEKWSSLPGGVENKRSYNAFLTAYNKAVDIEQGRETTTATPEPAAPPVRPLYAKVATND